MTGIVSSTKNTRIVWIMLTTPVLAPTSSAIPGMEDNPPGAVAKKLVNISKLLYFHKTSPESKEKKIDKRSKMRIVSQFS